MIHVEIRSSWCFLFYPDEMIWACLTYVKSHLSVARKKIFVKKFFDTSRYLPSPEARFILIYDLHRYLKPLGRKVHVKNFNTNVFAVFWQIWQKKHQKKKNFFHYFYFPRFIYQVVWSTQKTIFHQVSIHKARGQAKCFYRVHRPLSCIFMTDNDFTWPVEKKASRLQVSKKWQVAPPRVK